MKNGILVLGAGMLAHYLRPFLPTFASRSDRDWDNFHVVDILDRDGLREVVQRVDPGVVINATASGNIQFCEENPKIAKEVNHQGQRTVISVCNELSVKIVYISTNSVFCGRSGNYREEHEPHPETVYGKTKLFGELATREEADDWAIFRITALFGAYPGFQDFVQMAISHLGQGKTFPCWDQRISPTYGPFAAQAIIEMVERGVNGVWHIAGNDQLTRYEIGELIQKRVGSGKIEPIPTPPGLPMDRTMSIEKLRKELPGLEIPDFETCVDSLIPSNG